MADAWNPTAAQAANLGMGDNPFLGQANPYLQQNIDAASADMVNNYNLTTQPAFNKAMVDSGSFGNAGVAQMNADAQSTLQKNLGNLSNSARMQDYNQQMQEYNWQRGYDTQKDQWQQQFGEGQRQYNQNFDESKRQWQNQFDTSNQQWNLGFDRSVYNDAYSQNMNNLQMGMGLLGAMGGYTGQDITNSTTQQNTPFNYWQAFNQQANSLGQGYGTTTGQLGTTSNPMAAAMGGAQLGNAAMNAWNANNSNGQAAWNPSYGSNPGAGTAYNSGTQLNNNFGGQSSQNLGGGWFAA
jgi:hypothetical protein